MYEKRSIISCKKSVFQKQTFLIGPFSTVLKSLKVMLYITYGHKNIYKSIKTYIRAHKA